MSEKRALVSLILPAFNEEAILAGNLSEVAEYTNANRDRFDWEVIIVDDGSSDGTAAIADDFAARHESFRAVHHHHNKGLGGATKTGVEHSNGKYLVVLDVDLSYSLDHVYRMLDKMQATGADLVLASPYMKGGSIRNVPWLRRILSIGANKFLALVAHGRLSTLTCMVRAYRGDFARSLVLRSTGMDIMPETVYKSMVMRGRIEQVPAELDWGQQLAKPKRQSSMRILRHMLSTVLSGFVFRPFMFFVLPGLLLLAFSGWVNTWMVIHVFEALHNVPPDVATDSISWAVASAYRDYPHTFIVGLLSLMLSVQLISLGILALQSKSYFEEIYFLGASTRREPDPKSSVE
jgi:glycosyltransferase involved in cell wall biosynthesis